MDFRARVVDHYRSRGYQVRDAAKVRGQSGNVYAVDLVAQGPLGNIVVTFGGTDGLDEADVAHIRRVAKEVGATPVAAAERVEPLVRRLAARESVVVLDNDLPAQVQEPEVVPDDDVKRWAEDHPWPGSDRGSRDSLRSVALDDLLAPTQSTDSHQAVPPSQTSPSAPAGASVGSAQAEAAAGSLTRPATGAAAGQAARTTTPAAGGRFSWLSQGGYSFQDAKPVTVQPDAPTRVARESRDEVLQRVRERVDGDAPRRMSAVATEDVRRAREGRDVLPRSPQVRAGSSRGVAEGWWIVRFAVGGAVAAAVWWALSHVT